MLPFADYGRRSTYVYEMPAVLEEVPLGGVRCAGLNNVDRRGANFRPRSTELTDVPDAGRQSFEVTL